jgi:hypothetical protein
MTCRPPLDTYCRTCDVLWSGLHTPCWLCNTVGAALPAPVTQEENLLTTLEP